MEEYSQSDVMHHDKPFLNKNPKKDVEVYSHFLLSIYDYFVLSFCCPLIWRCSKSNILTLYNNHISDNHLDIGVGTGYFLDKCQYPSNSPRITLLDLNENCLNRTAKRIERYNPISCVADIYEPLLLADTKFNSVGLNYLLHCLPGSIHDKGKIFANITPLLAPNGTVFGATVLGKNQKLNFVARKLMKIYNRHEIFCNLEDDLDGLRDVLKQHFNKVEITMSGCVALFVAHQ